MNERISYLRNLLRIYDEDYSPYIKFNKEYWAQDGYWAKRQYKKSTYWGTDALRSLPRSFKRKNSGTG